VIARHNPQGLVTQRLRTGLNRPFQRTGCSTEPATGDFPEMSPGEPGTGIREERSSSQQAMPTERTQQPSHEERQPDPGFISDDFQGVKIEAEKKACRKNQTFEWGDPGGLTTRIKQCGEDDTVLDPTNQREFRSPPEVDFRKPIQAPKRRRNSDRRQPARAQQHWGPADRAVHFFADTGGRGKASNHAPHPANPAEKPNLECQFRRLTFHAHPTSPPGPSPPGLSTAACRSTHSRRNSPQPDPSTHPPELHMPIPATAIAAETGRMMKVLEASKSGLESESRKVWDWRTRIRDLHLPPEALAALDSRTDDSICNGDSQKNTH